MKLAAAVFVAILGFGEASLAATYYVDFAGGSDADNGTSTSTPWKHAPGDAGAAGNPATVTLQPGDRVVFRGGVVYRGSITVGASGTPESPIVFDGNASGDWGVGRAILDGSDPLSGWQPCASQAACGGNPNWQSIYYIDAALSPAPTKFAALYENDEFLWPAQDPNPPDPFYLDEIANYRVIPQGSSSVQISRTALTDPGYFTQPDPNYWPGAWIAVWRIPNVVVYSKITGYDPATSTIAFEDIGGDLYTDRDEYYSILNSIHVIDRPGEAVVDEAAGRIFVWPRTPGDPNQKDMTIARRGMGIDISGNSHLVIQGFRIGKYFADVTDYGWGVAIGNRRTWTAPPSNVVIRDNEVTRLRSMAGAGAIGAGTLIENNLVHENQRNIGIFSGPTVVIRKNTVRRTSRLGIWLMGARDSQIIDNTVTDIKGSHSNGISIYSASTNILVAGNKVLDSVRPLTFESSSDLTFYNNVLIGTGNNNVDDWGGSSGTVAFYNNTIVGNDRNAALNLSSGSSATFIVKNNIIDGGGGGEHTHNIYTGLRWDQSAGSLGPGEFVETDLNKLFVDPANNDFRLKAGSPAVDAGTSVPVYTDIAGTFRPLGASWDIGAYEYVSGGGDTLAPAAPTNLTVQ